MVNVSWNGVLKECLELEQEGLHGAAVQPGSRMIIAASLQERCEGKEGF